MDIYRACINAREQPTKDNKYVNSCEEIRMSFLSHV